MRAMSEDSGWQVPEAAPRHYQDQVLRFMGPFADALVSAAVGAGDSVLDVACGTGIATRVAATAVGSTGRVVGSDINAPMLEVAAGITKESGDSILWDEASALDLPYGDGSFDSVICQQGVQFFPDPPAGLREMARVTKTGGLVAVTVWSPLPDSPYLEAMYYMLREYCDASEEDVAWSSDSDRVVGWFVDGGLGSPAVQRVERLVELPALTTYVPAHMKATPWANQFASLSEEELESAIASMAARLSALGRDTGVITPFVSYLATAVV